MAISRSENMSRIKGKDSQPEVKLRKAIWKRGYRYHKHKQLPSKTTPDFVFTKKKVAVYVDGCFWHGCPQHYVPPINDAPFWAEKLKQNVRRDVLKTLELQMLGWRVIRIWSHEIDEDLDAAVERVLRVVVAGEEPDNELPRVIRAVRSVTPPGQIRRFLIDLSDSEFNEYTQPN